MRNPFLAMALLCALRVAAAPSIDWNSGVTYTYDASGNIVAAGTDHYVYDVAGRLVLGDAKGIRRTYAYDAFGNRTQCLQDPATNSQYGHTINVANNRIDGLTYDNAGNATSFEGHQYRYDLLNVQTVRDPDGAAIEYVYTADDQRIAIYTPQQGSWRWTLRDASAKVIRELTSHDGPDGALSTLSWTWTRDSIWRGDQLLASRQSGTPTYHYHLDHLGTPRRITTDTDQIVGIHDYHAFGPEVPGGLDEPSLSLLKFTAHESDHHGVSEDGATLDYMHARYYSGMMGRFLSVDPSARSGRPEAPQSWNRYAYARNNPIVRLDPDGLRDVYVAFWTKRFPYAGSSGSVGHVGVFELTGRAIVSQFPEPHGKSGKNDTKSYVETVAKENGRAPDHLYKVSLPDDAGLDAAAKTERTMKSWHWNPDAAKSQTNCAFALMSVLHGGGMDFYLIAVGPILPDQMRAWLKLQENVVPVKATMIETTPDKDKK
jgi:RHS repeat-associated protein